MQLRRCHSCGGLTLSRYGITIDPECGRVSHGGESTHLARGLVGILYRIALGPGLVGSAELSDWVRPAAGKRRRPHVLRSVSALRSEIRRRALPVHVARSSAQGYELCAGASPRIRGRGARKMRKAFIRMAVDLAMAENGYPTAYYGWIKPGYLEVWDGKDTRTVLHIPAIQKFKQEHLIAELSKLESIGPPRENPARAEPLPKGEQLDLEQFIASLKAPNVDNAQPYSEADAIDEAEVTLAAGEPVALRVDPTHAGDALAYALGFEPPAKTIDEMLERADRPRTRAGMHAQ